MSSTCTYTHLYISKTSHIHLLTFNRYTRNCTYKNQVREHFLTQHDAPGKIKKINNLIVQNNRHVKPRKTHNSENCMNPISDRKLQC